MGMCAGHPLLKVYKHPYFVNVCCVEADWEALGKGDKLDSLTKLSRRMEMQRIKDMCGVFGF